MERALRQAVSPKEIQSRKTMDMFVVYAYDRSEKDYVMLGKKKININISMEYDETEDKTLVYMSSPVYIGK